jgi:hypothetical protein
VNVDSRRIMGVLENAKEILAVADCHLDGPVRRIVGVGAEFRHRSVYLHTLLAAA